MTHSKDDDANPADPAAFGGRVYDPGVAPPSSARLEDHEDPKLLAILAALDAEDAKPAPPAPPPKELAPTTSGTITTEGVTAGAAYVAPVTVPPTQDHRTFQMAKVQVGAKDPARSAPTMRVSTVRKPVAEVAPVVPTSSPAPRVVLLAVVLAACGLAFWFFAGGSTVQRAPVLAPTSVPTSAAAPTSVAAPTAVAPAESIVPPPLTQVPETNASSAALSDAPHPQQHKKPLAKFAPPPSAPPTHAPSATSAARYESGARHRSHLRNATVTSSRARACLLAVVLAIAPRVAHAQPADSAAVVELRRVFEEGNRLYDAGKFAEAETKYLAAWSMNKTFDVGGNLGSVELKLGKPRAAAEHFAYALREFPTGGSLAQRQQVTQRFAEAKAQVVTLHVHVNTPGAGVEVDGAAIGQAPLADDVFVDPGPHVVRATLLGYEASQRSIAGEKSQTLDVDLQLVPKAHGPNLIVVIAGALLTAGALFGAGIGLRVAASSKESTAEEATATLKQTRGLNRVQRRVHGRRAPCQGIQSSLDASGSLGTGSTIAFIAAAGVGAGTDRVRAARAVEAGEQPDRAAHRAACGRRRRRRCRRWFLLIALETRMLRRTHTHRLMLAALAAVAAIQHLGCSSPADDCNVNPNLACYAQAASSGTSGGGSSSTSASTQTGSSGGGASGNGGGGGSSSTSTMTNCDPTMGSVDGSCGIFVSSSMGHDTDAGLKSAPVKSLAHAIAIAQGSPIYACGEAFSESVTLPAGSTLYGALDCAHGWAYAAATPSAIIAPADAIALTVSSGAGVAAVSDFSITAPDATISSGTSIGVLTSADLDLERVSIMSGKGHDGHAGAPQQQVAPGASGTNGTDDSMCNVNAGIIGGSGGAQTCDSADVSGGSGGNGVTSGSGGSGSPGTGTPGSFPFDGAGGVGQIGATACTPGDVGGAGAAGSTGTGAAVLGTLSSTGYVPSIATPGASPGTPGQGGGGGGGAKPCAAGFAGPSGGGGGGGGCGGAPGNAGGSGGASIGLVMLGGSLTMHGVTITTAKAGDGGLGGDGHPGGNCGQPGDAGGGASCGGGKGGQGGRGGSGGGGAGGPSVAIAVSGVAVPNVADAMLTHGTAGTGALGGDGDATAKGADGLACKTLDFTDTSSCAI